jgi:hypothetical protein
MRCSLLVLALLACKDRSPPPPPPAPPTDGVTLIQPGSAPHRLLRYHLTKGARIRSELVSDVEIRTDDQRGPTPTLVVGFETTVADVLADGTAKLRLTVTHTTVRDQPGSPIASDLIRSQAAAMHGVVITETLAPDGKLTDARVEAAPSLPEKVRAQLENLTRSLEQVAMRMPQEPVGIGATWRERKPLPEGGIRAVSETTYTLTSLMDDTIGYTSAGLSTGPPQTVEQDGMTAEVASMRGTTEARGSVDLSRYALSVTSTSKLTTEMSVVAPEGTPGAGASTIEITMAIQLSSADASSVEPVAAPGVGSGDAVPGTGSVDAVTGAGSVDAVTGAGSVDAVTGAGSVDAVTGAGSAHAVIGAGSARAAPGTGSADAVTGAGAHAAPNTGSADAVPGEPRSAPGSNGSAHGAQRAP